MDYPPTGAVCAYQNYLPKGTVGPDSKDDSPPIYIRILFYPHWAVCRMAHLLRDGFQKTM
eukprot:9121558-Karenia_brevis.AAC.1